MHRLDHRMSGWPDRNRCSDVVRCSISRRMSFIGSTERTRGTTSKLFSGGGDGVSHSSVLAFHGSGPPRTPFFTERTRLTIVSSTPIARIQEPIEEIRLYVCQPDASEYS